MYVLAYYLLTKQKKSRSSHAKPDWWTGSCTPGSENKSAPH